MLNKILPNVYAHARTHARMRLHVQAHVCAYWRQRANFTEQSTFISENYPCQNVYANQKSMIISYKQQMHNTYHTSIHIHISQSHSHKTLACQHRYLLTLLTSLLTLLTPKKHTREALLHNHTRVDIIPLFIARC
jgi:hypothetical protein